MELQSKPRVKDLPSPRNLRFKALVTEKYGTYRNFCLALNEANNGVRINEMRLSRIIVGRLRPTAEERKWFAWKLQVSAEELFPSE